MPPALMPRPRMAHLCLDEDAGGEGEAGDHVGADVEEVLPEVRLEAESVREVTTTTMMMMTKTMKQTAEPLILVSKSHLWLRRPGRDVQYRNRLPLYHLHLHLQRISENVRTITAIPKPQSANYVCVVLVLPAILLFSVMGAMRHTIGGVTNLRSSKS